MLIALFSLLTLSARPNVITLASPPDERASAQLAPEMHEGLWCASIASPGGELRFGLDLRIVDGALKATLVNGSERIDVPSAHVDQGELVLEIPHYDATVRAKLPVNAEHMEGEWKKRSGTERWTKLPFTADLATSGTCDTSPPRTKEEPTVDGRWSVKLSASEDLAVGVFQAKSTHAVEGTFLSTTGDYRFLAGTFADRKLSLSCFDGTHAFLFKAELQADDTLKGEFWSGDRWHETWTATRDAHAELADTYGRAHWNEDFGLALLCFPDVDPKSGKDHSLADPEFAGKARIVQILGSWCPNCHDETHFLADLDRRYRARGLSIVGLSFEITGDFERDAEQVRRTAKRHNADYPMLLAGMYGGDKAKQALPALSGLFAFPTTIFLHRDGRVRAVHSGFAGPGTGDEYTKLQAEFEKIVEELIDEPDFDDASTWKTLKSDDWRNERDRLIVRIERDADGKAHYTAWEALRFDRPTKKDPVAQGDVTISGTSIRIGPDLFHLEHRTGVMIDARDVAHRLTPATRSPFPVVDGTSYFEPGPMLAALKSTDPLLRREAVVCITLSIPRHEFDGPFDPTPWLADPDISVRCAAAWSAGQMKSAGSVAGLIECLDNGYAPLRREAARALGKIAAKDASDRLNALSHDFDPLVREAAKETLTKIGR